jgi:hypothetical protein
MNLLGVDRGAPLGSRFRLAAASSCAMVLLVFVAFSRAPFRVDGDIAYVAKAAQQFVSHGVPFNQLRLVDPCDLSRDIDTWIFWWPPGICTAFIALLSVGLTLGSAARLLMLTAAFVGAIGWAKVSAELFSSRLALIVSAVPTLLYVVDNEMFEKFSSGDPVVFAAMPWLFVLAMRLFERARFRSSEREFLALGVACGALYWIKFSALFGAAALMMSVGLGMIAANRLPRTLVILGLAALGFLVPIASLWLLNHAHGGDFLQSSISAAVPFQNLPDAAVRAVAMAVLPIESGVLRFLPGQVLPLIIRCIALVLTAIVIVTAWRVWGRGVGLLASLLVAVPLCALAYLTWAAGYGFLLDAGRHAGPYWVFLQLLLVGLLVGDAGPQSKLQGWFRKIASVSVAVLLIFAAFTPYVALRGGLSNMHSDRDALNGLYYPTLSKTQSGALAQAIRAQLEPGDVLVPASYWLGMDSWLAFDERLLPLTNFYQPLVATHGRYGADYNGVDSLRSTRQLRVLLILADPYAEPLVREWNERIKGRFDQAREWSQLRMPENTGTTVWSAVLSPTLDDAGRIPGTVCTQRNSAR